MASAVRPSSRPLACLPLGDGARDERTADRVAVELGAVDPQEHAVASRLGRVKVPVRHAVRAEPLEDRTGELEQAGAVAGGEARGERVVRDDHLEQGGHPLDLEPSAPASAPAAVTTSRCAATEIARSWTKSMRNAVAPPMSTSPRASAR